MRINRTNPEQPAAQPVQSHAPIKAQTEVNGFEPPEQEIPKENQKKPPKAAKPPKPKKEKPAKKPRRQPAEEVVDDEENEQPRRRFPFGCLIVLVILALVGFGGYKVSQFYAELDGQKTLGPTQTITVPEGSSAPALRHSSRTPVSSSMTGCSSSTSSTAARPVKSSTATLKSSPAWPTTTSSRRCPS